MSKSPKTLTSIVIALASVGIAYAPLPGIQQTIVVVSGTELQEPLKVLEARFEQRHPSIEVDLRFQGSQDIVNNYVDQNNDFDPTILIPANGQLLTELAQRWNNLYAEDPFLESPQSVARTMLVAVVWPQRARALFPGGQFQWQRLETALAKGNWSDIGGQTAWGSFDFVITNPARSNSGQLTLSLWSQAKTGGGTLATTDIGSKPVQTLFSLVKRSVYQPPRSTDTLLQEFITRGPNDADIATVYESVALHRWNQSRTTKGEPYQVLYLDPTIETVSTAGIVRRNTSSGEAQAARSFLTFLTAPEQQAVFVQFGFRPANPSVNIQSIPDSPWKENIPGAEVKPSGQAIAPPDRGVIEEVIRQWQRAN